MFSFALPLFLCVSASLAGSYAPAPVVEPSPSAYGSPYSYQQQLDYGYPRQQQVEDTIYKEPVVAGVPVPIQKTAPVQTYTYPIQATAQPVYEYPSTVYNDYDTTTVYTTTTSTTYAPATEASEDDEQYGVPEIPSPLPFNPVSPVLSAQEAPVISLPAQTQSYAPPPLVEAAPSAYGAPVPSAEPASHYGSTSSYGQPQYNELQYTAGEVPSDVVLPGTQESLPTETYPSRIHKKKIRAQKRFHKKH